MDNDNIDFWHFDMDAFKSLYGFIVILRDPPDQLAAFLKDKLSSKMRKRLNAYNDSKPPTTSLKNALIEELNKIIEGPLLCEKDLFENVNFDQKTRCLLRAIPEGEDLVKLNRWLLEQAYPHQIMHSQSTYDPEPKNFDIQATDYFIPPGLYHSAVTFGDHFVVAENYPIMIVGPTGVGKTLFLKIYEKLFLNEYKTADKVPPIVWANCAHFGGKLSDPNIARSELFGIKKGVLQGVSGKVGLISEANGGVLILEEIGELPMEVQAMLLTFIETNEYRSVGGKIIETSECKIVGATNHEDELREDFKYRFFPFSIPPLYERREDILYYLYQKYPDLVMSLTKREVLTLLCYHWPGNVREVDRVARLLIREKRFVEKMYFESTSDMRSFEYKRMYKLDERSTSLSGFEAHDLFVNLKSLGVDVDFLESLLNQHRVGLSGHDLEEPAFNNIDGSFVEPMADPNAYLVFPYFHSDPFEETYCGFLSFCELFFQYPFGNYDILSNLKEKYNLEDFDLYHLKNSNEQEKQICDLIVSIIEYLSGKDVEEEIISFRDIEDYCSIIGLRNKSGSSTSEAKNSNRMSESVWSMTENELLKYYYKGLLKSAKSNIKIVSKLAGKKYTTLIDSLKRLGLYDIKKK